MEKRGVGRGWGEEEQRRGKGKGEEGMGEESTSGESVVLQAERHALQRADKRPLTTRHGQREGAREKEKKKRS